jgi:cytidine deaminase
MPFKEMTKTDLVRKYLDSGASVNDLLFKSCSCYEGTNKPCGICRSCLRKYVALELNKVKTNGIFKNNPKASLNMFLKESIKKNRKKESKDIELCLNLKKQS